MKLKKVLSATFAALVLSSSLCFASVSQQSISESTMKTKCTDQARASVYVKNGSSYTEYWCDRWGKPAAQEIAAQLSNGAEVYTPNKVIYNALKEMGAVNALGSMRVPGVEVYHFIFRKPDPIVGPIN